MSNKTLILVGYARSGVTALNRCLSSDESLICLSEINSRFVCPTIPNSPHEQVHQWYGMEIPSANIVDEVKTISNLAIESDRTLLIRDWSFASFVPLKYNDFSPPKTLNTIDDISSVLNTEIKTFALVRNPIDIWLSMKNSLKSFHDRELIYLRDFIIDVKSRNISTFKYEDFCGNTNKVLDEMYHLIDRTTPRIFLSRNVIGDINYPISSRGADKDEICLLPRRECTEEERLFLRDKTCAKEILELLSYSDEFLL